MSYTVDPGSLRFHTPPGLELPSLLDDFCEWLAKRPSGSLGYFDIQGDRLDDNYIEDGTRCASAFVSFVHCPDGTRVGWWRPAGESLDTALVILLGGQGELRVLDTSLAGFLTRLARAATGNGDLDQPDEDDAPSEPTEHREALGTWLKERGAWTDAAHDSAWFEAETARLRAWFPNRSNERYELARQSPQRKSVAETLASVIGLPDPKKRWKRTFADLIITDSRASLFPNLVGEDPLQMPKGFERLLREFREHDADELPEAGLWFRAQLKLDAKGVLMIRRSYLSEPRDGIKLDDEGLRRDQAKRPRSRYWMPPWLAKRLGQESE